MDQIVAELTALNEVVKRLLIETANNATGGDKAAYLQPFLENGLKSLEGADWQHVPQDRRDAFAESVKSRYTSIVMAAAAKD